MRKIATSKEAIKANQDIWDLLKKVIDDSIGERKYNAINDVLEKYDDENNTNTHHYFMGLVTHCMNLYNYRKERNALRIENKKLKKTIEMGEAFKLVHKLYLEVSYDDYDDSFRVWTGEEGIGLLDWYRKETK